MSSALPFSSIPSISASTVAWMRGSISLAAVALVRGLIRSRNLPCSGGSCSIGGNEKSEIGGTKLPPAEEKRR
jgi:hypothetical protein